MDISQREGHYPPPVGCTSILGVEFSGHVFELGPEVSEWNVGDEVLGLAGGVSIGVFPDDAEQTNQFHRVLMLNLLLFRKEIYSGSQLICPGSKQLAS
jgi:threonine dehydrogenase-like Zn-dependent dehydrogenase